MKKQIHLNLSKHYDYQQDAFKQLGNIWIWNNTQSKTERPNLYPRSRIMQGSTPDLKIIISVKEFEDNADRRHSFYLGIFVVDLDLKKNKLLFHRKFYMGEQQQISDVVVHPNGYEMLIFQQKKILKYSILKSKGSKNYDLNYVVNYVANTSLETSYNFSNVQYHPSGQFVFGLLSDNHHVELFKFTHKTMKFFKLDPQNKFNDDCMKMSIDDFPNYFQSWNMAIDQDSGNTALSVLGSQFCSINPSTLQYKQINQQEQLPLIPTIYYNLTLNQSIKDNQKKIKSINYIQLDRNKYFIAHNYGAQINNMSSVVSQRFDIQQGKFVDNELLIGIVPDLDSSQAQKIKCIKLYNINGIACISQINNTIYFSQWDQQNNVTYGLLKFSPNTIVNTSKIVYNKQVIQSEIIHSNSIIEDITQYQRANQVCFLYNGTLTCLQIQVKCFKNSTSFSIIRDCRQECLNNKSTFWNPISLQCQACSVPNCKCASNQFFNYNSKRCVLSCSKITRAIKNSQYDNYTKCRCEAPFTWFEDLKICRFNCSSIKNVEPSLNYATLNISLCQCRQNYKFIQKLGTVDQQFGMCSLESCPKNTKEVKINNLLTCECDTEKGFKMGMFQQDCIYETKKQGMPAWSIFLIVLFFIAILGVIGYFIWRKKCKKSKKDEDEYDIYKEPGSPASNLQTKYNQKHDQRVNTQRMLKESQVKQKQKICQICNNTAQKTNCQSPCHHCFHFQCILDNKNDEQKIQCPSCSRQFQLKQITMKADQEFDID